MVSANLKTAKHILVVGDKQELRSILVKQFELRRFNVNQAGDGEEAWRKLQTLDYDCILLDLKMPGMGGKELYEKIEAEIPRLLDCIIFITGDTIDLSTKGFLSNVTNPVLSKPFDFRELEQLVLSITNRKNAGGDHSFDLADSSIAAHN